MIPAAASDPTPSHPSVLQRPCEIYRPFTSAELGLLRGYARDVRELGTYRFFEQVPSEFKLFGAAKPPMTEPDPEAVRAAVTLFRQLYLHTEPASFVQIMELLKRNVHERESPYRDEAIAEVQDLRIGQAEILRAGAGVTLVVNGTTISVEKIIDTYLHGYYLHAHNAKARLAEMLDNLPPLPRFTFYTVIFKLTKLYWVGANVVDLALSERMSRSSWKFVTAVPCDVQTVVRVVASSRVVVSTTTRWAARSRSTASASLASSL